MRKKSARPLRLVLGGLIGFLTLLIVYLCVAVPLKSALPVILGAGILLAVLVRFKSRITVYVCTKCSSCFKVSPWLDFFSPHRPNRKFLRCPECGQVDWHNIT